MSVVTKKPARTYTVRKPSSNKPVARKVTRPPAKHPKTYSGLPGWKDLAAKNERTPRSGKKGIGGLPVSTARFVLMLVTAVTLFTLYVGHVHSTQELLADVQELRRENLRLHLRYNRVKGEFDRLTGPKTIYDRAHSIGLEEGFTYGPTIQIPRLAE